MSPVLVITIAVTVIMWYAVWFVATANSDDPCGPQTPRDKFLFWLLSPLLVPLGFLLMCWESILPFVDYVAVRMFPEPQNPPAESEKIGF